MSAALPKYGLHKVAAEAVAGQRASLFEVVDTGPTSTATLLDTASMNEAFRGVALAARPGAVDRRAGRPLQPAGQRIRITTAKASGSVKHLTTAKSPRRETELPQRNRQARAAQFCAG